MNLFPKPKHLKEYEEEFNTKRVFFLQNSDFDINRIKHAMSKVVWEEGGTPLNICRNAQLNKDEYSLELKEKVTVCASTVQGVNLAFTSLKMILKSKKILQAEIHDEPDFENRGVMLDVSRSKVPAVWVMKRYIDLFEDMKYNQLQLYFEGIIFSYDGYEEFYEGKNPVTPEYINEIKDYCNERMIDLVPNHNSFGHMGGWLALDENRCLAECEDGYEWIDEFKRSFHCGPSTLNPLDDRSIQFVEKLYQNVLPHFDGDQINIGCDETFELGRGKSKETADKIGKERVYLNYMLKLHDLCARYGRKMMFWADMLIDHPEYLCELPKDSIPIVWGYEQEHPFKEQCKNASGSGLDFYVAPGTSSWGSMVGRSDNMVENQFGAAYYGRQYGAKGYLLTDWGQEGHCQFPVISYVPQAYGAGLCWGVEQNSDVQGALDYLDESLFQCDGFAKFVFDCGNSYKLEAYKRFNTTATMSILTTELSENCYMNEQTTEHFKNIIQYVDDQLLEIDSFKVALDEYKNELRLNLRMLRNLAVIGLVKTGYEVSSRQIQELIESIGLINEEYKAEWMKKNYAYNVYAFIELMNKLEEDIKSLL